MVLRWLRCRGRVITAYTADIRERLRKDAEAAESGIATWYVDFAKRGLRLEGSPFEVLWGLPVPWLDRSIDGAIEQALKDCQAESRNPRPLLDALQPLLIEHVRQVWMHVADRAYRNIDSLGRKGNPDSPRTRGTIEHWATIIQERIRLAREGRVGGKYVYRPRPLRARLGSWLATNATTIVVSVVTAVLTTIVLTLADPLFKEHGLTVDTLVAVVQDATGRRHYSCGVLARLWKVRRLW